jgi:hypothetical protein
MHKEKCYHENGRRRCNVWKFIGWGLLGVVGFALIMLLIGFTIMWLWNWLIPDLLKLPTITFIQALGLAVLTRILFGCGGHGYGRRHMKHAHQRGHGCHCGCHSSKQSCSDDTNNDICCKKEEATE